MHEEIASLRLRRNEERRIRAGHLWVFSNEVDVAQTPLTAFKPGEPVRIESWDGRFLGYGYVNPAALICARLVGRDAQHMLDRSLIVHRLNIALSLRERLHARPFYRLVFGETDGLPGLVVDRFDDVLVAQITTAGMQQLLPEIEAALRKVLDPRALVWRNDSSARSMEGLPDEVRVAFGEVEEPLTVEEGGLSFGALPLTGQKTGWFYDQRINRDALLPFVPGARVLDVFSYLGAWGLRAAAAGASEVHCVDVSARAGAAIEANVKRNGLTNVSVHVADAFEHLKALRAAREKFDVVVLDPPAFVKRRKDFKEGALAYRRINEMAMQILGREGILVTCSCSYHMPRAALYDSVQAAARHLDRQVQLLHGLQQSPDHPVHPAIPETDYLKGGIFRVLPV